VNFFWNTVYVRCQKLQQLFKQQCFGLDTSVILIMQIDLVLVII